MLAKMKQWLSSRGIHAYEVHRDPGEKLRIFVLRGDTDETCHNQIRIEYHPRGGFSFVVDLYPSGAGDEHAIGGHFSFPFLGTLYWSIDYLPICKFFDKYLSPPSSGHIFKEVRSFGFQLYEDVFWIYINTCRDTWSSKDPSWQHITIRWKDLLMGKEIHRRVVGEPTREKIFFPEKLREAIVTYSHSTWTRTRWPGVHETGRYEFEFQNDPIPVPGKGENSWDCGDDAIYSMSIAVDGPHQYDKAIKQLQESIQKTRSDRGGASWSFASMLLKRGEKEDV